MIQHQLVSMMHSLMISYMPQKKYIGPWLSVSVVVVLCVCLMSLELETGREINYTTSGSEIKNLQLSYLGKVLYTCHDDD